MSQKILAHHCDEFSESADLIEVKVDQVVLAREPNYVLGTAVDEGLSRAAPEVCVAYPPHCVSLTREDADPLERHQVPAEALGLGFLVAQPGAGFAPTVHLERFGSPARLILSDDPRLTSCGASGMLSLPASRSQLSEALRTGKTQVRPARSIQVTLTGRLRPFVCVRDVALELMRRGLDERIQAVDAAHQAPVVIEFVGPSCKFLSVTDRAVLCAVAPRLGAAAALFSSDEKTEIFLRDQKRSKAHRSLASDTGAPFEDGLTIDLAACDPLLMDTDGRIRPVRDLDGKLVEQVLLGGDTGLSLRDLLAAASLLKSKRVSPGVAFLLCPPSRQTLEVLARGDTLVDLLATGARLLEPDRRVLSGDLYPVLGNGVALRNADWEGNGRGIVASAETLAYAVAHGEIGDPRNFKRPVRVTVPRNLPTDDVLLSRGLEARGGAKGKGRIDKRAANGSVAPPSSERFSIPAPQGDWSAPKELSITNQRTTTDQESVFVAETLEDVRWLEEHAPGMSDFRAVIAAHIPAATVSILSGLGVLALRADEQTVQQLERAKVLKLTTVCEWDTGPVELHADDEAIHVEWLARGAEREWAGS